MSDQPPIYGLAMTSVEIDTHPQEVLRKALTDVSRIVKAKIIVEHPRKLGYKNCISVKSLTKFINGVTKELTKEHYDGLADAWLFSAIGREIRSLGSKEKPKYDKVVHALESGASTCPKGANFVGRYFMYYGSYVRGKLYGIRVISVESDDGYALRVTDSIRDLIKRDGKILTSHGSLTFFEKFFQLVLLPGENNETKVGFTLMVGGNDPDIADDGEVNGVSGTFLTMKKNNCSAFRRWLWVRERNLTEMEMIQQSGPFAIETLLEKGQERHFSAFAKLNKDFPKSMMDPMLSWNDNMANAFVDKR